MVLSPGCRFQGGRKRRKATVGGQEATIEGIEEHQAQGNDKTERHIDARAHRLIGVDRSRSQNSGSEKGDLSVEKFLAEKNTVKTPSVAYKADGKRIVASSSLPVRLAVSQCRRPVEKRRFGGNIRGALQRNQPFSALNDVLHGQCLARLALIEKRRRAKIGKVQDSAKKDEKNDVSDRFIFVNHLIFNPRGDRC